MFECTCASEEFSHRTLKLKKKYHKSTAVTVATAACDCILFNWILALEPFFLDCGEKKSGLQATFWWEMMNSTCQSTDSACAHVSSTVTKGDTESCSHHSRETCKCLASTALCTDSIDYKSSSASNSVDSLIIQSSGVSREDSKNPSLGNVSPPTDMTVDSPLSVYRVSNNVLETSHSPVTRSTSSSSLEVRHYFFNDQCVDLHLVILFNST